MVTWQDALMAQTSPLLDPPTRAVLAMAFLAFVILGLGLMVGVMLGGRWFRRWGGDDLRQPLPLHKTTPTGEAAMPAMLRGVHWNDEQQQSTDGNAKADPTKHAGDR